MINDICILCGDRVCCRGMCKEFMKAADKKDRPRRKVVTYNKNGIRKEQYI